MRRRSGSVRGFAHVLAGVYRETSESDYSNQGGGRHAYMDSQPMWLIGCGVDVPVGKGVAVRLSVENLRVSPDGSALRSTSASGTDAPASARRWLRDRLSSADVRP